MDLTKHLSNILRTGLGREYTSVSYAIMIDGEIIAADSLGNAGGPEKKPATVNHTYNVCSVSKVFCTTAVMQLVEQGKVELDAPVYKYLPRFTMPDERYRNITVRHILCHTSGLPGTQCKNFSATHVGKADNNEYYDEVYKYLSHSHLKADPGKFAVYCNDGFTLAEMIVAEVSGIPFGEYCKKYITEPIGAHSTRTSTTINEEEYPLVRKGNRPKEYFYLQGCGGFTTTMSDLCRFGNLFLTENEVISEESKAEMRKEQGTTFVTADDSSRLCGLGWDSVNFKDPEFDLGEHVQLKSGNSFQFDSMFYVIPEYNAVLAISETQDCNLNIGYTVLNMFAVALLETKGINIFKKYKPVPRELIDKYEGIYVSSTSALKTHFYGTTLTFTNEYINGDHIPCSLGYVNLNYDGESFVNSAGDRYFFTEAEGRKYLVAERRGQTAAVAERAENHGKLSDKWEARIGKKYIAVDIPENDLSVNEIMASFELGKLKDVEGVMICSFASVYNGASDPSQCAFVSMTDDVGRGFNNTPYNGSRDMIDPMFKIIDDIEYCDVASYLYRDAATFPVYEGQNFSDNLYGGELNSVYRLPYALDSLPEIPEGHRIIMFNDKIEIVYDSMIDDNYTGKVSGYISLI